jgi:hypothetical protein
MHCGPLIGRTYPPHRQLRVAAIDKLVQTSSKVCLRIPSCVNVTPAIRFQVEVYPLIVPHVTLGSFIRESHWQRPWLLSGIHLYKRRRCPTTTSKPNNLGRHLVSCFQAGISTPPLPPRYPRSHHAPTAKHCSHTVHSPPHAPSLKDNH